MDPVRVPSIPAASFPLPPRLEGLRRLAYNLHWSWHPRTRGLFNLIDRTAWARYRNPIPVISGPTEWSRLLDDAKFLAEYHDVLAEFDAYMANGAGHWFQRRYADQLSGPIAYFCAEYGFHESLGIYSGGLGVLAGDHMKSASDMALPAIGVGLLYRKGYFRQTIDADGHQEHDYPDYDLTRLPLGRVQDASGRPLTVTVELPGRDLTVAVWVAQVGRVPVLLLDTDLPENDDADRPITNILYVRGREMRLHQELVLGIGGVRAHPGARARAGRLAPQRRPLGVPARGTGARVRRGGRAARGRPRQGPARQRLHDPHAGLGRQRAVRCRSRPPCRRSAARRRRRARRAGARARSRRRRGPRPVRHDRLLAALDPRRERRQPAPRRDGQRDLAGRGRAPDPRASPTASTGRPGSGSRSRELLEDLGADLDDLDESTEGGRFWERMERIPGRDLWDAHLRQKRELAHFARGRLRSQFARHGESPSVLAELETALDPDVLTVGFARRFATYKRAGLLFSDIDRLARMLFDETRPIQIVFAGKAHPADRPGQRVIQEIFQRSRSPQLRGRVYILENYDMRVARFLVQGVDVWLNNPRRPLEASGTSGMKAAQNGVPNVSVLDGWWDEGYEGDNGWAIGDREMDPDEAAQDWRDSQDLYRLLEEQIVPAYYDRDAAGLPTRWLTVTRRAMATALWRFSTTRMLREYTESLYLPAAGVPLDDAAAPAPAVTEAG